MRSIGGRTIYAQRQFGRFPLGVAPALILLGFLALAWSGPYFPVFPLVPLFFVLIFFVVPAIRNPSVRGAARFRATSLEATSVRGGKEKELLRALERHAEITAARAALESSLGVAEAEEMLTKLASGGHVEVRAWDGHLTYALHPADRSEAEPKGLASGTHDGPSTERGE
jgi:hypothetical protein